MIAFTVDEAKAYKKSISQQREFKKEYRVFSTTVNLFVVWFLILTSIRALFVATIIVSLFNNQPDLIISWNQGYGFIGLIIYLIASSIDFLQILDIGIIIAVIIGAFSIGNGITANFLPFLLPIILCYAITFGLILASNYAINAIIEKKCPKIYKALSIAVMETQIQKRLSQF